MSIEKTIEELTAAIKELAESVKENSKVAVTCTTTTSTASAEVEAPAPAKKAAKPKKEKAPEPEPDEPVEEFDREGMLRKITEFVKGVFVDPERDTKADQKAFMALREGYGVEKTPDLPDDKLEEFYLKTVELLS